MKRWVAPILLLLLVLALVGFRYYQSHHATLPAPPPVRPSTGKTTAQPTTQVPAYVRQVLSHIRQNGEAPAGYVGGREFQNKEKRLPQTDAQGRRLHYSEWDVRPKVTGQNRGPERLITSSDHRAWYTADHYRTFQPIE